MGKRLLLSTSVLHTTNTNCNPKTADKNVKHDDACMFLSQYFFMYSHNDGDVYYLYLKFDCLMFVQTAMRTRS